MQPKGQKSPTPREPSDPHQLAEAFLSHHRNDGRPLIRYWQSHWHVWEAGRWVAQERDTFQGLLTQATREELARYPNTVRVRRGLVGDVLGALQGLVQLPTAVTRQPTWLGKGTRYYVAVRNGLLDLGKGTPVVVPHDPDWFSPVCLPYAYDVRARCPRFLHFLNEFTCSNADIVALLQEWFGYCLTPPPNSSETIPRALSLRLQRFLLLVGQAGAGKSVLSDVLTSLLGRDNVSNVPLEFFGSRFQLHSTLGKLVNVAPEVGHTDKGIETALKQFVGGDRMFFDRKNLSPINTYPTARLVMTANTPPRWHDHTDGIYRRMLIVPCDWAPGEAAEDARLTTKLEAELPGILNWALEGMRRLLARGKFPVSPEMAAAREKYHQEANPTRAFIRGYLVTDSAGEITAPALYATYQQWCLDNGCKPSDSAILGRELRHVFPGIHRVQKRVDEGRVWVYLGVTSHQ